jgi:hypothetical protein
VPEHDQAGHIAEAAEGHGIPGGPARDDRHGARPARQHGKRGDGTWCGCRGGRILDNGRQGAVVVGRDERVRRVGRHRGQAGLAAGRHRAKWGHRC